MTRRLAFLLSVAAAAMTTLPTGASTWRLGGSFEPDTPHDVAGPHGWLEPDLQAAGRKVYFNAVAVQSAQAYGTSAFRAPGTGGGLNPNAPGLGTRLAPPASVDVVAYLGVWKDCNGDGYVGAGQTALFRYRVELLDRADVCPPGGEHFAGGWVWEFIPIRDRVNTRETMKAFHDPGAGVWADFGAPGDRPEADCREYPLPRGATSSTGGLLRYADCGTGHSVARLVNAADEDGTLGLRFDDPAHPERSCGSALHRPVGLYGNPHRCPGEDPGALERGSGRPAFAVWDCDRPRGTHDVRDPTAPEGERGSLSAVHTDPLPGIPQGVHLNLTDETGSYASVPAVAPGPLDPRGSWIDALHDAEVGAAGRCQGGNLTYLLVAFTPAALEDPTPGPEADAKRAPDFAMAYQALEPEPLTYGFPDAGPATQALHGADKALGLHAVDSLYGVGWRSTGSVRGPPQYTGTTVRGDLTPGGPVWITAYARVGDATTGAASLATPPGTYGQEACGADRERLLDGWDCDPGRWWRPDLGAAPPPAGAYPARPGDRYHMRDVDCLDGTVAPGAQASLVAVSGEPACAAPGA